MDKYICILQYSNSQSLHAWQTGCWKVQVPMCHSMRWYLGHAIWKLPPSTTWASGPTRSGGRQKQDNGPERVICIDLSGGSGLIWTRIKSACIIAEYFSRTVLASVGKGFFRTFFLWPIFCNLWVFSPLRIASRCMVSADFSPIKTIHFMGLVGWGKFFFKWKKWMQNPIWCPGGCRCIKM